MSTGNRIEGHFAVHVHSGVEPGIGTVTRLLCGIMKGDKIMVVGYIRVSTAMQKESAETQRYGILSLAHEKQIQVNDWVVETISGKTKAGERQLGVLLERLAKGDVLIVAEFSRLGRSLVDILTTVHTLVDKGVRLLSAKEKMEFGADIQSRVLSVVLGLVAEIERSMIAARTKEALARLKSEGRTLGRPRGSLSKSKLDGKEDQIREFLSKRVSKASISKILGVHPGTLDAFIKTRKISTPQTGKEG